jgi:pimeloyl-ACP methyl ester carboxylesterase
MQPWPELKKYAKTCHLNKNRQDVFYFDTGETEKPACFLIHGLGDDADSWRHVVSPLSRTFRVIAPDLPGFGRSGKPKRCYTVPYMEKCLLELMDALSVRRALLIGSSLGGIICQFISLRHPDRVSRLVLEDGLLIHTAEKIRASQLLFLTFGVGEYFYSSLGKDPDRAYNTLRGYYADLDKLSESDRSFLYQRVNERVTDRKQRFAFFSLSRNIRPWIRFRQKRFRKLLRESSIPTLVLWGEEDRILPVRDGESLASIQVSARIVKIPGSGHLSHQERPDRFLDAVRPWIEELPN